MIVKGISCLPEQTHPRTIAERTLRLVRLFFATLLVGVPVSATAATYYVDPAAGSNANNGTSTVTPWLNPPGTRNVVGSGYWSSTWGSKSTSNKVACGDVVLLKGGSTQTSSQGGSWNIDGTYYTANCTTNTRISIRIAASGEWAGSSGNFTIDGTGVTPSCTNCPTDRGLALINVGCANFIEVRGLSDSQRIVLTNVTGAGFSAGCYGTPQRGLRGDWWNIMNAYNAATVGSLSNWQISNVTASGIRSGGFLTGFTNDWLVDGGAYVNATIHDSGCGTSVAPLGSQGCACPVYGTQSDCNSNCSGPEPRYGTTGCSTDHSGSADAFNFTGGVNMWCINCTAYQTGERGMDAGVIWDPNLLNSPNGEFRYHWRNIVAYSNGLTCNTGSPPHWCASTALLVSGSDWSYPACTGTGTPSACCIANGLGACPAPPQPTVRSFINGLISWGHLGGAFGGYGGLHQEAWHAVFYNNGGAFGLGAEDRDERYFNSISPTGNAFTAGSANPAEPTGQYTPTVLSNCLRPNSANSEALGGNCSNCNPPSNTWPGAGTYTSPPAWITAASNKLGLTNCDPKFVALSTSSFAANDFHLQAGSSAIDGGRFFLLANGAGTNASTITVKSNGGWADPRDYFISPTTYLDATPDTVQIQNATCAASTPTLQSGQAQIVSMTATTITLDRACSWTDGAGIHLPWTGSAPDMGAFEFGATSATAPTLISVQLAP